MKYLINLKLCICNNNYDDEHDNREKGGNMEPFFRFKQVACVLFYLI
jgi:hypothetical protein